MRKSFQELTIKDAFMFAAVMTDPDECKTLISTVLGMEILDVKVDTEKSIVYHPAYHGVRLDVLAVEQDTQRRFNVEMQVKSKGDLPKRSRYYHSQMDMDALLSGAKYHMLPDTYVIFICDFDPFGKGLYRYTFENRCKENGEWLNDGNRTVFLSTKGNCTEGISKELVSLLTYIGNPYKKHDETVAESEFVKSLKVKVNEIKQSRDWEAKFMLLKELMEDEREAGKVEERARVNRLNELLAEQHRVEDIIKASKDTDYQEQLFEEFGL